MQTDQPQFHSNQALVMSYHPIKFQIDQSTIELESENQNDDGWTAGHANLIVSQNTQPVFKTAAGPRPPSIKVGLHL